MSRIVDEDVEAILQQPTPWATLHNKSALVTGATGMLGPYLVKTLLALRPSGIRPRVIGLARYGALAEATVSRYLANPLLVFRTQSVESPCPGQSYVGRAATTTRVGINLAGGGCSDLIIARVIDPDFSAWQPYQHPESIANGPYREPVVVPGVTSTTSAQPGRHLLGDRAPPHR